MGRKLTLILLLLLTFVSLSGYLFLTYKINGGNLQVALGEKQIKEGEEELAKGKARLSKGGQQLSGAKTGYSGAQSASLAGVVALTPVTGGIMMLAHHEISKGDQQVAEGKGKVKAGEKQLAAGKLKLQAGKQQLSFANKIRIACGIMTIVFVLLLIILGIRWRLHRGFNS